jgi:hypothetical protein
VLRRVKSKSRKHRVKMPVDRPPEQLMLNAPTRAAERIDVNWPPGVPSGHVQEAAIRMLTILSAPKAKVTVLSAPKVKVTVLSAPKAKVTVLSVRIIKTKKS